MTGSAVALRQSRVAIAMIALAAAITLVALGAAASPAEAAKKRAQRSVLFVGNNWDGTADVIHPRGKFRRIARINII